MNWPLTKTSFTAAAPSSTRDTRLFWSALVRVMVWRYQPAVLSGRPDWRKTCGTVTGFQSAVPGGRSAVALVSTSSTNFQVVSGMDARGDFAAESKALADVRGKIKRQEKRNWRQRFIMVRPVRLIVIDISHLVSCPRSKRKCFHDFLSAPMKRKLFLIRTAEGVHPHFCQRAQVIAVTKSAPAPSARTPSAACWP